MPEMSWVERMSEHRRICLLRTLASAPAYRANDSLLHDVVNDEFALGCSRDQVRTDLAWLRDQGLVRIEEIAGVYIVELTRQGEDVASGRQVAPGVKRPTPR